MSARTLQQLRDLLSDHADMPALAALEQRLGQEVSAFRDAGVNYMTWARRFEATVDPVFFLALEGRGDVLGCTLAQLRGKLSPLRELAALTAACAEAGDRLQAVWQETEATLRTMGLLA